MCYVASSQGTVCYTHAHYPCLHCCSCSHRQCSSETCYISSDEQVVYKIYTVLSEEHAVHTYANNWVWSLSLGGPQDWLRLKVSINSRKAVCKTIFKHPFSFPWATTAYGSGFVCLVGFLLFFFFFFFWGGGGGGGRRVEERGIDHVCCYWKQRNKSQNWQKAWTETFWKSPKHTNWAVDQFGWKHFVE